jgi:hypothetical protein
MSLRTEKMQNDAVKRAARRAMGHRPSPMQMGAGHAMDLQVSDRSALPVTVSTTNLQNTAGQSYFVVGWSAIGGSDLMI